MDSLIARAQTHDPDALTEIYERYNQGIYRYIYQRVQDPELAEDITADVFVRMLEGIARYEDRGWSMGAWLYRIAHDRSVDALRRMSRRVTVPLEPEHKLVSGPEETVLRLIEYDELRISLARLTPDQRSVLELRYWGEVDIYTTAAHLGKTEGAVKALQHRAVGALNRIFAA